jgi:uncharacterized protein (TIGR00730 family)
MSEIRTICVYCGSGPGNDPAFVDAARQFGKAMADNGIRLIYGGGKVGIMGAISEAVLQHGGKVTGIIPEFLVAREHARKSGDLVVTRDMHERKRKMFEMADAFVAMPGGVGTLEEIVEQITWVQLGRHKKPVLLANVKSFWEPLRALLVHMEELNFIRPGLLVDYLVADRIEDVLPMLRDAAAKIPEPQKAMASDVAGRM